MNPGNSKTSEPRYQHYKNNKLKTIDPTLNDEFELLFGFYYVSGIKDYFE